MQKIWAIGLNTFREAIRNKVLYSLLFFAVTVILASLAFGALSVHEEVRLTTDLGLAGMSLFAVIIAIFVGVNLVYKELERKTIYMLLPKPIQRWQFVLGKFVGLVLTLGLLEVVMTGVLLGVLALQGAELRAPLFMMVSLIFLEVVVVTAVAVLFSSFSTPFLSGAFTIGVFLLGRSVPDIRAVAGKLTNPVLASLLDGISRVVPNLRYFYATGGETDGARVSVNGVFVDWSYVGLAGAYGLLYATLVLLLAMALFSRRDFV
ncbi:MAG: ABC transporter permease [Deltaproteobacteria bacterium]|nr:ABC transporter permease [Deltaproteobacteria bacterium]